jgi:hypothetical protein
MARGSILAAKRNPTGGMIVIVDQNLTTGETFFVHSTAGVSGGGRSAEKPATSIAAALALCTANQNDHIILMPGHAETISAAAGIAIAKAGVTIRGLGNGANQPTITFDTAIGADLDVDAAGVTFRNVHFRANFADITAAIDVNADDFTLDRCRFSETATDMNALIWVQDAAAGGSDRITIKGCHAIALDAANTHFVNFAGTGTGHVITDNVLIGDWGTMAIGGAGVITACLIRDNLIYNATTSNDACVKLADTATGIVAFNHAGGGAAQANGFKADACAKSQNFYGDLIDASAILDPIAT